MQLWGIDIVGGVQLVDTRTGEVREAKLVTGVDDHSRFCVMAAVVERATSRAVCLAFARALARFGGPEQVITDNGKQLTDRLGKGGEVLFDRICRRKGISHLLTAPALREPEREGGKIPRHGPPGLPHRRRSVRQRRRGAGGGRCLSEPIQHRPAASGPGPADAGDPGRAV
jgi:transposase InsO family protein